MTKSLVFLIAAFSAFIAWATDVPFGGDALQQLTFGADAVVSARIDRDSAVKSGGGESNTPTVISYVATVNDVLSGPVKKSQLIEVAFPITLDVTAQAPAELLLFLKKFELPSKKARGDSYIVVSGRYGAVPARLEAFPNRVADVRQYLLARNLRADGDPAKPLLDWTEAHVNGDDPFLRRSAVIDLYEQRDHPRAVEQLSKAVQSKALTLDSKQVAVRALEKSSNALAAKSLAQIAENDSVHEAVRKSAVAAVYKTPTGIEKIMTWTKATDPVLSNAAIASMKKAAIERQVPQ